jgi:hypothetical protein
MSPKSTGIVFPFSRLPGRASEGKTLLLPTAPAFKGLIGGIGKNLSTKGVLARKQALWLSPAGKLRESSQFHSYTVNRGEGGEAGNREQGIGKARNFGHCSCIYCAATEIDRTEIEHTVILRYRIVLICKTGWGRATANERACGTKWMVRSYILMMVRAVCSATLLRAHTSLFEAAGRPEYTAVD